jgi:Tol biopolymer transport system component
VPGSFTELERDLIWVGRDGQPLGESRTYMGLTRSFHLSPDGTRVMKNTAGDVWIDELASGRTTRVTNAPDAGNFGGIFTSDGKSVVFSRGLAQDVDLFMISAEGKNERRLTSTPGSKLATSISRDGRWLLFHQIDPVTLSDIWVAELSDPKPRAFVKTTAQESYPAISPDNKWVAYQSNESGRFEVFVRSFPDGDRVVRVSSDGGIEPEWSFDGSELLYRGLDNKLMAMPVRGGSVFEAGKPQVLFDARGYENRFEASTDGQRFLMMPLIASEQSSTQINIIQNFLTELRQRVK